MSDPIVYETVDESDALGLEDSLVSILSAHADGAGRPFDHRTIAIEARGADGRPLGGAIGSSVYAWAFLRLLAVDPAARGRGIGRGLIAAFEAEARRRACVGAFLDTFSFQAPAFYARLGYQPFGRLEDMPPGGARIFYYKRWDVSEAKEPR